MNTRELSSYTLSGKLELATRGEKKELPEGDAVFDSTVAHRYRRTRPERAVALVVTVGQESALLSQLLLLGCHIDHQGICVRMAVSAYDVGFPELDLPSQGR